jgi:hypothetical protein
MPTPHTFASSVAASGTRPHAAATHRRVKPAGEAHARFIAFEDSRRLTGHLRPPRGIDHWHAGRLIQQAVEQGRVEDCAHPGRLAPPVLGDVDDRVRGNPHSEQHDLRNRLQGAHRSWRTGHIRQVHAVLARATIFHYLDFRY